MALWTAEVFVNSDVGTIRPTVEASTFHGARDQINRIYGPVTQIVNLRQVNTNNGGGSSSSGGSGCTTFLGFIVLCVMVGSAIFGGDGDSKRPSTPPQSPSVERTIAPAPVDVPSYANPPGPCVTDNFEPC